MLPRFSERIEAAFERLRGYELSCVIVWPRRELADCHFLAHQAPAFFLVTPCGEAEFTSVILTIPARPNGRTVSRARTIEENFVRDLQTGVWHWENSPSEVWQQVRELSRRHGPPFGCRALDALHVASALTLAADDLYTFDRDQAKLARAVGLRVLGS